jgi:hypothetical protein
LEFSHKNKSLGFLPNPRHKNGSGFGSWARDKAWLSPCIDSGSDKASALYGWSKDLGGIENILSFL